MKKVELLSPVGNMDMLYQAIHNGADAVYLSGIRYGARAYANNFNKDELLRVIKYCHLYGVRIYITINTLIYESEVNEFIKYVEFLYVNGVDAVIMQDFGMINTVCKMFPNLDVHASTQCHNHNEECIKMLKDIGVKRVVMAREMSLGEIKNINVDIEKEVFVYGALCVCYSGCCLFSSLNGGRSGNRGECVGSCRLPYKLIKNNEVLNLKDKYLLSTRELNTINNIDMLLNSNIDSLKIEGRMKSPYYVGYITRLYRMLIDKYYNNEEVKLSDYELNNLKKLFNRDFTKGYLFNDIDIMNNRTPNHQGIYIGDVVRVDRKYIYIKINNDDLYQEDGIRFETTDKGMIINKLYNNKLLLVKSVSKDCIAVVENKFKCKFKVGERVLKTIDKNLIDKLNNYDEKKIPVSFRCEALKGKRLKITIIDIDNNEVCEYGDVVDESINREVDRDDIIKLINKVGNTPFVVSNVDVVKDDNIFINLRNINEVRRRVSDKLMNIRSNKNVDIIINDVDNNIVYNKGDKICLNILVRNEEQLKCAIDNDVDNIYISDYELYNKYKNYETNSNIYYRTSRVNNKYIDFNNCNLLVGELGSIYKYKDNNNLVSDYYLNVTNKNTIKFLRDNSVDRITLSVELSDNEVEKIMNDNNSNIEIIVYGRLELMIMKYCPLRKNLNYCNGCKDSKDKFYLEDRLNNRYPIIRDNCLTHIMHYKNINKVSNMSFYKKIGINNYRIELFDEDYYKCQKIVNEVRDELNK